MVIDKICNRVIEGQMSIFTALKKMDEERVKLLFVFEKSKFQGILTIGDIQRAIINNSQLTQEVKSILAHDKQYANEKESLDKIKEKMYRLRAECMPIISDRGDLLDVYFWNDFFSIESVNRSLIDLPVVIMAGGMGTRLKPLTNVIPKPLIPINDKTILEIILEQFSNIGCSKFYISLNYKYEIIQYYLDNLDRKYDLEMFREEQPLGTIGSVSLLRNKIDTPFFVSNCDIIIDQDYRDVYDYHKQNENDITIVTAIKSYKIPYGVIETGEKGLMTGLSEKPEITYIINTGVYILQPQLIEEIPEKCFFHITHLMEKVKKRGGKIGCFPVSGNSWTDIGDWDEYLKLIKR